MALTPEDVVNKRFQPTKFREGYDQDEVDDFLDEVVVELRRLGQENEELRQRLLAGESRINELQRAGNQITAPSFGEQAQVAPPAFGEQPQFGATPAPIVAPAPVPAPAGLYANDPSGDPGNTNNLLQLARKLHEEHVREGIEKRDALIAEGHAAAARVVGEAEAAQRAQLGALDKERIDLERRIEGLRNFEREYRQKLKGYIEGQLRELESPNAMTASTPAPQQAYQAQPAQAQPQSAQPQSAEPQPAQPQQAEQQPYQQPAQPVGFQGFGGN
jgi:DivIVA domain-containing protein